MANRSKLRQLRWWRKWYESGAIRQPEIPEESRILGIATHYRSDGDGSEGVFQTLSVGMARIALSCIRPLSKLPHLCYSVVINKTADLCTKKYQNSRMYNSVAKPA